MLLQVEGNKLPSTSPSRLNGNGNIHHGRRSASTAVKGGGERLGNVANESSGGGTSSPGEKSPEVLCVVEALRNYGAGTGGPATWTTTQAPGCEPMDVLADGTGLQGSCSGSVARVYDAVYKRHHQHGHQQRHHSKDGRAQSTNVKPFVSLTSPSRKREAGDAIDQIYTENHRLAKRVCNQDAGERLGLDVTGRTVMEESESVSEFVRENIERHALVREKMVRFLRERRERFEKREAELERERWRAEERWQRYLKVRDRKMAELVGGHGSSWAGGGVGGGNRKSVSPGRCLSPTVGGALSAGAVLQSSSASSPAGATGPAGESGSVLLSGPGGMYSRRRPMASDVARSEAQFKEIMDRLEFEASQAEQHVNKFLTPGGVEDSVANIPDMILDPWHRLTTRYINTSTRIEDPEALFRSTRTEWSEEEVETFVAKYAEVQKNWKRIAACLPRKEEGEVVTFYYLRKHELGLAGLKRSTNATSAASAGGASKNGGSSECGSGPGPGSTPTTAAAAAATVTGVAKKRAMNKKKSLEDLRKSPSTPIPLAPTTTATSSSAACSPKISDMGNESPYPKKRRPSARKKDKGTTTVATPLMMSQRFSRSPETIGGCLPTPTRINQSVSLSSASTATTPGLGVDEGSPRISSTAKLQQPRPLLRDLQRGCTSPPNVAGGHPLLLPLLASSPAPTLCSPPPLKPAKKSNHSGNAEMETLASSLDREGGRGSKASGGNGPARVSLAVKVAGPAAKVQAPPPLVRPPTHPTLLKQQQQQLTRGPHPHLYAFAMDPAFPPPPPPQSARPPVPTIPPNMTPHPPRFPMIVPPHAMLGVGDGTTPPVPGMLPVMPPFLPSGIPLPSQAFPTEHHHFAPPLRPPPPPPPPPSLPALTSPREVEDPLRHSGAGSGNHASAPPRATKIGHPRSSSHAKTFGQPQLTPNTAGPERSTHSVHSSSTASPAADHPTHSRKPSPPYAKPSQLTRAPGDLEVPEWPEIGNDQARVAVTTSTAAVSGAPQRSSNSTTSLPDIAPLRRTHIQQPGTPRDLRSLKSPQRRARSPARATSTPQHSPPHLSKLVVHSGASAPPRPGPNPLAVPGDATSAAHGVRSVFGKSPSFPVSASGAATVTNPATSPFPARGAAPPTTFEDVPLLPPSSLGTAAVPNARNSYVSTRAQASSLGDVSSPPALELPTRLPVLSAPRAPPSDSPIVLRSHPTTSELPQMRAFLQPETGGNVTSMMFPNLPRSLPSFLCTRDAKPCSLGDNCECPCLRVNHSFYPSRSCFPSHSKVSTTQMSTVIKVSPERKLSSIGSLLNDASHSSDSSTTTEDDDVRYHHSMARTMGMRATMASAEGLEVDGQAANGIHEPRVFEATTLDSSSGMRTVGGNGGCIGQGRRWHGRCAMPASPSLPVTISIPRSPSATHSAATGAGGELGSMFGSVGQERYSGDGSVKSQVRGFGHEGYRQRTMETDGHVAAQATHHHHHYRRHHSTAESSSLVSHHQHLQGMPPPPPPPSHSASLPPLHSLLRRHSPVASSSSPVYPLGGFFKEGGVVVGGSGRDGGRSMKSPGLRSLSSSSPSSTSSSSTSASSVSTSPPETRGTGSIGTGFALPPPPKDGSSMVGKGLGHRCGSVDGQDRGDGTITTIANSNGSMKVGEMVVGSGATYRNAVLPRQSRREEEEKEEEERQARAGGAGDRGGGGVRDVQGGDGDSETE